MKKIILMGRSECGKTTLTQALKGDVIHYHKTQYINHYDVVIDTPALCDGLLQPPGDRHCYPD